MIWILAGCVLLAAELALPGAFLLWIGIAAVVTGGFVLLFDAPFWAVVLLFVALLAASITAALRVRAAARRARPALNQPDSGLAGRLGMVLSDEGTVLRVRLGDSDWAARPARGLPPLPAGTRVRVEGVDGTLLVVRPDGG
nr:NfeD family protein [Roseomonas acroporae]